MGGNVSRCSAKGAPHQDLGADFMSHMVDRSLAFQWNVEENNVPPTKAVAFDENFTSKVPLMKDWIDVLKQEHERFPRKRRQSSRSSQTT